MNLINSALAFSLFSIVNTEKTDYILVKNNTFTIHHTTHNLDNILNYNMDDIDKYKINIDHHLNMYSIFTQEYFRKCDKINDKFCTYDIYEQNLACHKFLEDDSSGLFDSKYLYYYGTYTDQVESAMIEHDGKITQIFKSDRNYTTDGMYVIEDLLDSEKDHGICEIGENKIQLETFIKEPHDFYRKMMIYIVPYQGKKIFCPIWMLKDRSDDNLDDINNSIEEENTNEEITEQVQLEENSEQQESEFNDQSIPDLQTVETDQEVSDHEVSDSEFIEPEDYDQKYKLLEEIEEEMN